MTIIYFTTNQPLDAERFFKFLSFGVMSGLVGQSMGTALGAALNIQVFYLLLQLQTSYKIVHNFTKN